MSWEIVVAALVGVGAASLLTAAVVVIWLNLAQPEQRLNFVIRPPFGPDDPQFRRTMSGVLQPQFVEGNHIETLVNGEQIFPAMLEAIRSAERSITFESYVYWAGEIGQEYADALTERAAAGVEVRMLLDWAGSKAIGRPALKTLRDSKVDLQLYHRPSIWQASQFNHRTHRKLMVVDGRDAFIGGVGIADQWFAQVKTKRSYRDNHYHVRGPVVHQIQSAFMDNWQSASGEVLLTDAYFPPLKPAGSSTAQVFKSTPHAGATSARLMFLLSISAARQRIRIGTPYFVPDDQLVQALCAARERGVDVEIILPSDEHMDYSVVMAASRWRWEPLLKAGVRIYRYADAMYHCKVMIVDATWVSVGSANLDYRSFGLNDEANLNVLDGAFTEEQARLLDRDLERSRPYTLDDWRRRPRWQKAYDRAASLIRSQL